jgi:hypothetical protein
LGIKNKLEEKKVQIEKEREESLEVAELRRVVEL